MKENKSAENVLGTLGAILWTVQIIPQIIKSHRTKSTLGLSGALMFIWAVASIFLGPYIVARRLSIPLQIQPQLFGVLSAGSWAQCLHYGPTQYSKLKASLCWVAYCVVFAGFEAGSVYALWAGQDNGTEAPLLFYGYASAVLLAVALLPQYWYIWKLKEVVGISLIFMAVDILGGIFSFSSLFFRPDLDVAAFVSYALVVLLDGIVVILAFILNPMARRRREKEAAAEAERPSQIRHESQDFRMDRISTRGSTQMPDEGIASPFRVPTREQEEPRHERSRSRDAEKGQT